MKKGVILYVTEGKEMTHEWLDLRKERKLLGADAVCLATSESEIAFNWWHLLTRGMQEITCMKAACSTVNGEIVPHGTALRLCG
jgi:hypothetical protein